MIFSYSAHLPDALCNDCKDCKPQIAQIYRKVLEFMQKNHPKELEEIYEIYKHCDATEKSAKKEVFAFAEVFIFNFQNATV